MDETKKTQENIEQAPVVQEEKKSKTLLLSLLESLYSFLYLVLLASL